MSYRPNPVLEKLDHAAEASGFPAFSRRLQQALPVPFRVAPAVLIALAVSFLFIRAWWSVSLMTVVWSISIGLYGFGPLRTPPGGQRDERERVLLREGHFAGMAVTLGVAIGGCLIFCFGSAFAILGWGRIWVPTGPVDWCLLALFLMSLEANAALLAASWALPRKKPVDEDEE